MTDEVNEQITNRIATVEDDDLESFLTDIVRYEREVAAQSKPHYKSEYRRQAMEYLDEDGWGDTA